MKINKVWLSGVIAYILGQIALKYGLTLDDNIADMITEVIITFILPMGIAFMNKLHHKKEVQPSEHDNVYYTAENND